MEADNIYLDRDFNSLECFLDENNNMVIRITDKNSQNSNQVVLEQEHVDQLIIYLSDELNKINSKSK